MIIVTCLGTIALKCGGLYEGFSFAHAALILASKEGIKQLGLHYPMPPWAPNLVEIAMIHHYGHATHAPNTFKIA